MVNFRRRKEAAENGGGQSFLAKAKAEHEALFARFLANQEEYESVEEYTDALAAQAWELVEVACKESYRNGIARGRRGGGKRYGDR